MRAGADVVAVAVAGVVLVQTGAMAVALVVVAVLLLLLLLLEGCAKWGLPNRKKRGRGTWARTVPLPCFNVLGGGGGTTGAFGL